MGNKPASTNDGRYIPTRTDAAGEVPALRQGEVGSNEADGTLHVMKSDGRVSTLPNAIGFTTIQIIGEGDYAALVAATATIATVLYIVTPDPEE